MSPIATDVAIRAVAKMIREGDFPAARRLFVRHMADADEQDQAVIIRCAQLLQRYPKSGVAQLRRYWKTSDERARTIIAACAPAEGEQRQRQAPEPDQAPRWTRRTTYQAPGTLTVRQSQPRRTFPQGNPVRSAQVAEQYQHERAGIDDTPPRGDEPVWGRVDLDREILRPLVGLGCVALGCNLELTEVDRHHGDWLCSECRDIGRPGIDPLPADHTRTHAIERLCGYIWTHYPHSLERLRSLWRRLTTEDDRTTVTAWVTAHTPPEHATTAELTACTACGHDRCLRDLRHTSSDDGQCAACRSEADTTSTPEQHPASLARARQDSDVPAAAHAA